MKDHTKRIIELLGEIRKRDFSKNEVWKVRAYDKVIKTLKLRTEPIYSFEDVKGIPGIGEKISKKIQEIIETGDLEQVHNIDQEAQVITELSKVFGIGPIRGKELYMKHGVTSIEDLKTRVELLNEKQKIGLKYYENFEKRIPRIEMQKHDDFIVSTIKNIDQGINIKLMGSYRRGDKDSGDIDVLLTHIDDTNEYEATFNKVIEVLKKQKYLIDTFAQGSKKYNGVCRLKKHRTFRRIDLMYTNSKEFPFALLYFTGSQDFNVKLRSLALEKGYTLNEHGLKHISGENKGELVRDDFKTEEDVLKFMGLKYIEPEKRSTNINLGDYLLD